MLTWFLWLDGWPVKLLVGFWDMLRLLGGGALALALAASNATGHGTTPCPAVTAYSAEVLQLDISDAVTQEYIDGDATLQFSFEQALEISTAQDFPVKTQRSPFEYDSGLVWPVQQVPLAGFWGTCTLFQQQIFPPVNIWCTSGTGVDDRVTYTITILDPQCAADLDNEDQVIGGAAAEGRQWEWTTQYIWQIQPDLETIPPGGGPPVLEDFCTVIIAPCNPNGGSSDNLYAVEATGPHNPTINMLFTWGTPSPLCHESGEFNGLYPPPVEVRVNWWADSSTYDGEECWFQGGNTTTVKCTDPCSCCDLSEKPRVRAVESWSGVKRIYR